MFLLSKDIIAQTTEAEGDRQVALVVGRHPRTVPRLREEVTRKDKAGDIEETLHTHKSVERY